MYKTTYWQKPGFFVLVAGLVLVPLAFGGTTGWFTNAFAVIAGTLGIIRAISTALRPDAQPADFRAIVIPAGLFGIAVLWCFAQAWLPVSDTVAHEAWRDAADLLDRDVTPVLSLNPEASIAGALRLAGYGIVFFLCFQVASDETRAIRLLMFIAGAGAVYALYGIGLEITESTRVLWYARTFEDGNLSSTFPNRNAFASYAALCLLSGCLVAYRRRIRLGDTGNGWRRALVALVRYYFPRNGWFLYVSVALFVAILLTHSRAGLATAVVAFAVFASCAARGTGVRSAATAGSALIALCAIALFWILGGTTVERFDKIEAAWIERLEIYRLTVTAILDRPLLGTGLGTFQDVFPAYRTAMLRANIEFAHNSYLENALEMGVPAAAALYGALTALFFMFVRALITKRTAHPYPALGISVITAVFFHSLFDYAIQFPAVTISLAAILGIAAAQSFGDDRTDRSAADHADRRT